VAFPSPCPLPSTVDIWESVLGVHSTSFVFYFGIIEVPISLSVLSERTAVKISTHAPTEARQNDIMNTACEGQDLTSIFQQT
jgi:hypothetical protein